MSWTQVCYRYDGTYSGFLSCVFHSYVDQEEPVEIVFAEVPDQIFEGRITKVTDQDYVVTVTIQGDISGLYDGMTGDVTFLKRSEKLQ